MQVSSTTNSPQVSFSPLPTVDSTITSYSYQDGPYLGAQTACWSQFWYPVTVGTVLVTVDQIHNTTLSRTVYNTEVSTDGTLKLFTRTDTNAQGTVTTVFNGEVVAYPTHYIGLDRNLTWYVISASSGPTNSASVCVYGTSYTSDPIHPTPPPTIAPTDTADPSGWMYSLLPCSEFTRESTGAVIRAAYGTVFSYANVSSIWPGTSLIIDYTGCPFTANGFSRSTAAAGSIVSNQASFLVTSTTTLSSVSSTPDVSPTSSPAAPIPQSSNLAQAPSTESSPKPSTVSPAADQTPTSSTQHTSVLAALSSAPGQSQASPVPMQSPSPVQNSPPVQSTSPVQNIPPAQSTSPVPNPTPAQSTSPQNPTPAQSTSPVQIPPPTPSTSPIVSSSPAQVANTLPPLTIGSSIVTPNSASQYIVGGQTLSPSSAITVSGSLISYPTPGATVRSTLPPLTVGSSVITPNSASQYIVGTQTLLPSAAITVAGSIISYPATLAATTLPPITIGSAVITAVSSRYVVNSQTLVPGSNIVISGTTISLASGATQIVVGGSTQVQTTGGVGGYIWTAIAGTTSSAGSNNTGFTPYRGDGARVRLDNGLGYIMVVIVAGIVAAI